MVRAHQPQQHGGPATQPVGDLEVLVAAQDLVVLLGGAQRGRPTG